MLNKFPLNSFLRLFRWSNKTSSCGTITVSGPKTTLHSWHSRLGHLSSLILNTLISKFSLPVASSSISKHLSCSDCLINKSHKLPFSQTSIVSERLLQYVYTDVWTSPILSIDNYKYYLSRWSLHLLYLAIFTKEKIWCQSHIHCAFKALVDNRFQTRLGTLFSNNGGEFIALRDFLSPNGTSHLTSPPHTPEHNGLSERKHRTLWRLVLRLWQQHQFLKNIGLTRSLQPSISLIACQHLFSPWNHRFRNCFDKHQTMRS